MAGMDSGRILKVAFLSVLLACTCLWSQDKPDEKTPTAKQSLQAQNGGTAAAPKQVFKVGNGVSAPKVIDAPDPQYSEEARISRFQGTVVLLVVVNENGIVEDVKVARSLGRGLDEKAIEAIRHWKFMPAIKDRQPVAVLINVAINFRLTR